MKFFLELVSCCGPPSRPAVTSTTPPRAEETRSLVPPAVPGSGRSRRRKRGRLSASGGGSVAEWRPSLCVISEDNVVPEKEERRVGSEREAKRKAGSTVRVHVRSYSDEFRRAPLSTVIPAFSPTPFIF